MGAGAVHSRFGLRMVFVSMAPALQHLQQQMPQEDDGTGTTNDEGARPFFGYSAR